MNFGLLWRAGSEGLVRDAVPECAAEATNDGSDRRQYEDDTDSSEW